MTKEKKGEELSLPLAKAFGILLRGLAYYTVLATLCSWLCCRLDIQIQNPFFTSFVCGHLGTFKLLAGVALVGVAMPLATCLYLILLLL